MFEFWSIARQNVTSKAGMDMHRSREGAYDTDVPAYSDSSQMALYCVTVSRYFSVNEEGFGTSYKCHSKWMALFCVIVTGVTVSEDVCS